MEERELLSCADGRSGSRLAEPMGILMEREDDCDCDCDCDVDNDKDATFLLALVVVVVSVLVSCVSRSSAKSDGERFVRGLLMNARAWIDSKHHHQVSILISDEISDGIPANSARWIRH